MTVYARNAPSSVAPVALASLFRRRLVIRTGPTLANLVSFDKNPTRLEHLGVGKAATHRPDAVPWESVVTIEGKRIVVADGTELV